MLLVFCYNKSVQANTKKRIGILRGGAGEYYKSSLNKGGDIILYIAENLGDKYQPVDILVDKNHIWHYGGVPVVPGSLINKVDVIWNTSHPSLSNILESLSVPSIGIGSFLGSLVGNREMLKKHLKNIGVHMPRHILLSLYQEDFDGPRDKYAIKKAKEVFEKFGAPWIVKSFTPDSSMGPVRDREGSQRPSVSNGMGVHVAKTFGELVGAIEDGVNHKQSILIEEFIDGSPSAIHSVGNFRGEDAYILPPKNLSPDEKEKIVILAKDLRRHLNGKHYLKFDFISHPRRGIFLTNIDPIPDLRRGSHFEESCELVGVKMHNVIEHILNTALL